MNYTVSANGRRLEVMDDSETVSYTTSGLVYGEVQVSAINTCGQESQPATINIPAAGKTVKKNSPSSSCFIYMSNKVVGVKYWIANIYYNHGK